MPREPLAYAAAPNTPIQRGKRVEKKLMVAAEIE